MLKLRFIYSSICRTKKQHSKSKKGTLNCNKCRQLVGKLNFNCIKKNGILSMTDDRNKILLKFVVNNKNVSVQIPRTNKTQNFKYFIEINCFRPQKIDHSTYTHP